MAGTSWGTIAIMVPIIAPLALSVSGGSPATVAASYTSGTNYGVNLDIVKGNQTKIGGNGTELDVYYDTDTDSITFVVINTYVGKVASAFKATSTKDAYMVDVAGAVSEIAISSIADDTNNSVWFQLDDDGMIETLYVEIVDAPTSVDGETTANATATLTSNRGTITLKVKNTSSTTATTAWSAQMQIKNTQTGLVTYVDMGSGAALAANADNSEKTIAGNSINLYQALVTINGVTIASNQVAG